MSTICASGCDPADHAVADAHEVVVAAVVGEQGDDHRRRPRQRARRPGRRCRAARPRRARSRPCSRAVSLVTGPIETTRAPSGGRAAGLEEEAHGGAGGEGHVGGAAERRELLVGERLGHGLVERHHVAPRRRARAGRRAARRAPPPRGPPARRGPPPARVSSASTSPSATKRSGTTSARIPWRASSAAVPGPIAATVAPASARASGRSARAPRTAGARRWGS